MSTSGYVQTKSVMAHELSGKFKAKSDFIKYFKEHRKSFLTLTFRCTVQLYLHEDTMFNKDFLK